MRHAFTIISLVIGSVAGLAILIVLAGALAALFARCRREKEMTAVDWIAAYIIMGAGLIITIVSVSVVLCWEKVRGKPLPPPPMG
jgi:DMSO reductase anchor subunit